MDNTQDTILTDAPLDRPLVTFALFAYNQDKYIRQAVEAAFSQTYQPLEIILSDDCSTDRTWEIIHEMAAAYKGPHIVKPNKNSHNLGISGHFSHVLEAASGAFVVIAAGDDISLPRRTTEAVKILSEDSTLNFVESNEKAFSNRLPHSDAIFADAPQHINADRETYQRFDLQDYMHGNAPRLTGSARTIRKSAWQKYAPLNPLCPTEDTPSVLRLLMIGAGAKVPSTGVLRRIHDHNASSVSSLARMRFAFILSQYLTDIDLAIYHGYISSPRGSLLKQWASSTIKRRQALIDFHSGRGILIRRAVRFLLSPDVGLPTKIKTVARYVSSG